MINKIIFTDVKVDDPTESRESTLNMCGSYSASYRLVRTDVIKSLKTSFIYPKNMTTSFNLSGLKMTATTFNSRNVGLKTGPNEQLM